MPDMEERFRQMESVVASLARKTSIPFSPTVRRTTNNVTNVVESSSGPGFSLVDEGLLVDHTTYAGASGDWNTLGVSSLVGPSATMAYVRFRGVCSQDTESIQLKVRASSTANERTPLYIEEIETIEDTCSNDNAEWIPLSSSRTFDYQPTWTVAPRWSLVLLGYG